MQENIIGYLLGALDDGELAEFEAELDRNEALQAQVQDAARSLQVLDGDSEEFVPPAGLVEGTLRAIGQVPRVTVGNAREWTTDSEAWSLFDVIVAVAVAFVGCMLFLPAIQGSRIHTQIAGCQNNLLNIGRALIEYSESCPQGAFPRIPNQHKTGIAGIYAPVLLESGFLSEERFFYCPSFVPQVADDTLCVPRIEQLATAEGESLEALQVSAGGSYCYTLGYLLNGVPQSVRNEGRDHYPIIADWRFSESQSDCASPPNHQPLIHHRNVFFECGAIRRLPENRQEWRGDRIFEDAMGRAQAGVNKHDAVLGASWARPIPLP